MMFKNNISRTAKIIYATVFAKTLLIFLPPIFVYAKTKELEIQPLHPFFSVIVMILVGLLAAFIP